jgi:hypothetical protein
MKQKLLIGMTLMLVGLFALSGFTPRESSLEQKGKYWYMALNLQHATKGGNYKLITHVFYSSEKPRCSDLMKHVDAHYEDYTYGRLPQDYCVPQYGYDSEGEALKARDKAISNAKNNSFKILYTNFTGY